MTQAEMMNAAIANAVRERGPLPTVELIRIAIGAANGEVKARCYWMTEYWMEFTFSDGSAVTIRVDD
jgi:hypothetical protein